MTCKNEIKLGATFSVDLQRVSSGVPVDLTGYEIESFLKHPKFGEYELDVVNVALLDGRIKLVLESDITSGMIPGTYIWDIRFTHPVSGEVEVFPKDNSVEITFVRGATPA